jgi:predicted transcriptional regulator of viral defense system
MPVGRPPGSAFERAVIEHLREEDRTVLDLQLDSPWLAALARNVPDALHQMRRRGTLRTLQRGRYVVATDPADEQRRRPRLDDLDPIADAVLRRLDMDYYVSWHSALWHYGLIDQQSRRIYVAVTKRKRPARLGRADVKFVTVAERKFFGRTRVEDFDWPVWMATVEKALIDSFDQPHLVGPLPVVANALRAAYREGMLDPEQLVADAIRFGTPNLNRRLGYFMDLYNIPGTDPLALRVGRTYAVPLAPGRGPDDQSVPVNPRWRVYEDPAIVGAAVELK